MQIGCFVLKRLTWLLLVLAVNSEAQTAKEIIDVYFKAIGGADRWQRVTSKFEQGYFVEVPTKNRQLFNINSDTLFFLKKYKRPNKYFFNSFTKNSSSSSTQCFNGEVFWAKTQDGKLMVQSKEDSRYFEQVNMMGLADVLLENSTIIEYLGEEELDGKKFHALKIKRNGWLLSQKTYFDQYTGLPFCSTMIGSQTIRFTLYKDYKSNEGITLHYSEEIYDEQWNLESVATFFSIRIDSPVSDDEFEPRY